MSNHVPRLSILAQFDDLVRCSEQLNEGIEQQFVTFVKNQDDLLLKSYGSILQENMKLRAELDKERKEYYVLDTKFRHIKYLLDGEINNREQVERERKILQRQITLIKEVLLADQNGLNDQTREKLAFLNTNFPPQPKLHTELTARCLQTIEESYGSILSPSDLSYDKTDDDLDLETILQPSTKRKRSSQGKKVIEDPDKTVRNYDMEDRRVNYDEYATIPAKNTHSKRSFSEPAPTSDAAATPPKQICKSESEFVDIIIDSAPPSEPCNRGSRTGMMRQYRSLSKINRNHTFCTKTVIRPETCFPCGNRIKFYKQALRCQDCQAICHLECKDKLNLPCYPATPPCKGPATTIADYAPTTEPMVPALVMHCVFEIEKRGLTEQSLYRMCSNEAEVKDLKDKFLKQKGLPRLCSYNIHTICGTLKSFLRSLREPLVTRTSWGDFVRAANMPDIEDGFGAVYQAISQLPQPNRDTLAYLMMHLNDVVESPSCQMSVEDISDVFGVLIVGYSVPEPSEVTKLSEAKNQFMVMRLLLKIPCDYWRRFVNIGIITDMLSTPVPSARYRPDGLFPPLSSTDRGKTNYKGRGVQLSKTPLTPRHHNGSKKIKRQFFSTPRLK